jgi:hypothetical protein
MRAKRVGSGLQVQERGRRGSGCHGDFPAMEADWALGLPWMLCTVHLRRTPGSRPYKYEA